VIGNRQAAPAHADSAAWGRYPAPTERSPIGKRRGLDVCVSTAGGREGRRDRPLEGSSRTAHESLGARKDRARIERPHTHRIHGGRPPSSERGR